MRLINVSLKTIYGRKIIEGLNLIINKNDKIALIGEEGNGKSTLLKLNYQISFESFFSIIYIIFFYS